MSADVRWNEQFLADASEDGLTVSIVHVPGGRASAVPTTGGKGSCSLSSFLLRLHRLGTCCAGGAVLAATLTLDVATPA